MKLRIQDNSIRFRITLKELQTLGQEGRLRKTCVVPGGACLNYGARVDQGLVSSEVLVHPFEVEVVLCADDFAHLEDPTREGVYLQREWTDEGGAQHRCMAFIEKDRPGGACAKREEWIYEGHHGGESVVVPIPGKPAR